MTTLQRELKRGTLEMILLRLLQDRPMYGYELVSELEARSAGGFPLKEGTLYPVLYRLEDDGFIEPEWDQPQRGVPRKYYQLTATGSTRLAELAEHWRGFVLAVDQLMAKRSDERPGQ